MALDLVNQNAFEVEHNLPLPEEINIHQVSEITVSFPEKSASGFHSRSEKENQRIFDPGAAEYEPVTFYGHASADDAKKIFDAFRSVGEGDLLRGYITVKIVNPLNEYSPIIECNLHDLTLQSYNPGFDADVDNPDVVSFSFTVLADRMELKTG